ncbi:MAG: hypothetical protein AAF996_10535 [Pseudomonadota bacterium]
MQLKILSVLSLSIAAMPMALAASPQTAEGSVIEYIGVPGELIVSRDSITYYLSTGDELFSGDVLRSRQAEAATIIFRGCEFELPASEDVALDDEFCAVAAIDEPTMAAIAGAGAGASVGVGSGVVAAMSSANAPLVVGGAVLSAGGIAATTGGDGGGAGSPTSASAGNPTSNANSP